MNKTAPEYAFILAAGLGKRLKPYTDQCPKPLVPVGGRPIIDHVLDRLVEAGVRVVTVNLHYRREMLEAHLAQRTDIEIRLSIEDTLLDTGGGLKAGLAQMPELSADQPFYIVSGDSIWTDAPGRCALHDMATAWDANAMDLLLMLQPLERMVLTAGNGDYDMADDGRAVRSLGKNGGFVWTSVRLCTPALFDRTPDGAFSFLDLMDRAEKAGRLYGHIHHGVWHHITSADDLHRVDRALCGDVGVGEDVSG